MASKQPQLEAFSKIMGMLEDVIFNGSTGNLNREFYTVPHPGIFISPNLKDQPRSDDMALIAAFFNGTFDSTVIYNPQLSSVSQLYEDILTQSALPNQILSPDKEKLVENYEEELLRIYDSYAKYKERYNLIEGDIYRAQVAGEPPNVVVELKRKLELALQEWRLRGRKERFEELEAEVAYYRSLTPRRHFLNLRNRYQEHTSTAPNLGSYQSTYLQPPIHEWNSPYAGWAQFSKIFKYSELHKKSKHTKWSGSVGASFGLFKNISIGASGEKIESYESSENIDIELKFEYLRVRILRPWLVPDLFMYRFWTYKKSFGYRVISTGYVPGSGEPIGPKGLMPVLPTDFVIARNVSITANFQEHERKFIQETLSGSVSGGWGMFSARGSYSTTSTQEDVIGSFDGTSLKIANPQIIGFMGILVPETPDPNRNLPWEDDADFGDDPRGSVRASGKAAARELGFLSPEEYLNLAREQHESLLQLTSQDEQ